LLLILPGCSLAFARLLFPADHRLGGQGTLVAPPLDSAPSVRRQWCDSIS